MLRVANKSSCGFLRALKVSSSSWAGPTAKELRPSGTWSPISPTSSAPWTFVRFPQVRQLQNFELLVRLSTMAGSSSTVDMLPCRRLSGFKAS